MKLLSLVPVTQMPSLERAVQSVLGALLLLAVTCLLTWTVTTINWQRRISQFRSRSSAINDGAKPTATPPPPPMLPYAIPWLGHALTFLSEDPGSFWRMLRAKLLATGTDVRICTIVLGGKKAHVVNSAAAVQALFRTKHATREIFKHQLGTNALGASAADTGKFFSFDVPLAFERPDGKDKKQIMEALHQEFLLSQTAVNALAGKFMECIGESLAQADFDKEWKSVDLLSWTKTVIFDASTKAVFGTKILEMIPNLAEQYWKYDSGFLVRFYGLPKLLRPEAYAGLEDLIPQMEQWAQYNLNECGGKPPTEPEWSATFGCKLTRARHRYYDQAGLSLRGKAALDLGFMFGLSGNVIPLTNWILLHLFDPQTPSDVLPRILTEVEKARRPDNGIDVATLLSQPLLNSVCHETMRHYVDCLVTRQLDQDTVVDGCLLKKNDLIMAPSALSQHDATFWEDARHAPSPDTWYAERFLRHNASTGEDEFSTSWAAGKFLPFGGGGYICPGRVFAKQEVLLALATFLLRFDIMFVEFLGMGKKGTMVGVGKAPAAFPKVKHQYAGNGTLHMDGSISVLVRRK